MKDMVFKYYKDEIRAYALVFKYIKPYYYLFHIMAGVFALVTISSIFISLFTRGKGLLLLGCSLLSMIMFFISGYSLYRASKRIVRRKYKIIVKEGSWKNEKYREFRARKFAKFLLNNGIRERWKIEKLIELYKSDIEKSKLPPLIAPSLFILVLSPNLTQYLLYIYRDKEQMNSYEVFALFLGSTLISLLIMASLASLKRVSQSLMNEFILSKNNIRANLISLLEDLLLRVPDGLDDYVMHENVQ